MAQRSILKVVNTTCSICDRVVFLLAISKGLFATVRYRPITEYIASPFLYHVNSDFQTPVVQMKNSGKLLFS